MANGLSKDDIAKLERVVSKVDALTARQEEIIEKVLKGEAEIGKRRIAYLTEYFDLYSSKLDSTVARKLSELGDAYLILERQAASNFAAAASEVTKKAKSKQKTSSSSGGGGNNPPDGGNNPPGDGGVKVGNTVSSENKGALKQHTKEDVQKKLDELTSQLMESEEARYQQRISNQKYLDAIAARHSEQTKERYNKAYEEAEKAADLRLDLDNARYRKEEEIEAKLMDIRASQQQALYGAQLDAENLINNLAAEMSYVNDERIGVGDEGKDVTKAGEIASETAAAKDKVAYLKKLEEDRLEYIRKKELEAKRKNDGILSKEAATQIQKDAAKKFKLDLKSLDDLAAEQAKREAAKAARDEMQENLKKATSADTFDERKQALKDLTSDEDGNFSTQKAIAAAINAISDMAKQLEKKIDDIASYKSFVDTRLQGSSNEKWAGSYWDQLVHDMTRVGAINPYFKQEAFANNIKELVNRGIAFDLKQRAFLMTIQEKIANTFDVADGTLLRLIRIQQEDSTAGRLGMESALNSFLNNMYETSEYLSSVANSVRGSLEETQSLMLGAEAAEVEYQVQKWLGSLYSVGMSQSAVQSISTSLGQITAGQIEGLTNGNGAGNLIVMAANDAGLSIADILTDGIDASDTNKLLQASVEYLAELAESAKDNNVVQQQLANVFGVRASDLRAATNLVSKGSIGSIYGNSLTYDNMLMQLANMAGSMGGRTSLGEMMTNIWDNAQYSLAGSMASNPISYFIYKLATVVDNTAGGISVPAISVMGNMVDLQTTVSDLMRVAAVGTGLLGSFGSLVQGLGNSFSGRAMLAELGISAGSGLAITPRGDGSGLLGSTSGDGQSTSSSGYIGNASSSDIKKSTLQEAENTKEKLMVEAKEEEESNQIDAINVSVVKIYELLNDVAKGNNSLSVRVEGYGLTKAGGSGAGSGAQGGVAALNSSNGGNYSSGSGGGINSSSVSGNIDLGGWIMV